MELTCVCGQHGHAEGGADCTGRTVSLNSNCVKNRRKLEVYRRPSSFALTSSSNSRSEYEGAYRLATAKLRRKQPKFFTCALGSARKWALLLRMRGRWIVNIACITAGKDVPMPREWCVRRQTRPSLRLLQHCPSRMWPGGECGWGGASRFPARE